MLLLWAAAALFVSACSRDPEPGTPEAAAEGERIMRGMSDTLAGAAAFRFTTTERLERIGPDSERHELRFSRTATVRRPDSLAFDVRGLGESRAHARAYYDGRTVSVSDESGGVWAMTTVPATLDEMLDDVTRRYSLPVPVADVIYSVPYDAFIGPDSKGGFAGRETLGDVACVRLAYADDFVDVQVWIPASGQALPRRVELTYKRVPGAPAARVDFESWDLAPQIADGTFAFQPADPAAQIDFGQLVAGLLSGGNAASPATTGEPATGEPDEPETPTGGSAPQ